MKVDVVAKRFAELWTSNGQNALQAYKTIKPHVTDATAQVEGAKYLRKPMVQMYIQNIQNKESKKLEITRESLIEEYAELKARNKEIDDRLVILAMQEQSKLLGLYAPEKHENKNYNVNLTDDEQRQLDEAIAETGSKEVSSE